MFLSPGVLIPDNELSDATNTWQPLPSPLTPGHSLIFHLKLVPFVSRLSAKETVIKLRDLYGVEAGLSLYRAAKDSDSICPAAGMLCYKWHTGDWHLYKTITESEVDIWIRVTDKRMEFW